MQANKSLIPPDFELGLSDISCVLQEKKSNKKKKVNYLVFWLGLTFKTSWLQEIFGSVKNTSLSLSLYTPKYLRSFPSCLPEELNTDLATELGFQNSEGLVQIF